MKTVHIGAEVEEDLRDELLRLARKNDRSFSAELRRALRLYVLEHQITSEDEEAVEA